MELLLITLLISMGLPFLFQVAKVQLAKRNTFLSGIPSLVLYMILCGVAALITTLAMGEDLLTMVVCGLAIFLLSQGFYVAVLSKYLPGRGSVG